MPRLINKHVSEIGIGPDAIVYRGSNSKNKIVISEIVYGAGEVQEKELQIDQSCTIASSANKNTWVKCDGVHDAELMKRLSNDLGIEEMIFTHSWFMKGVYTYKGSLTNMHLAKKFDLKYKELSLLMAARF